MHSVRRKLPEPEEGRVQAAGAHPTRQACYCISVVAERENCLFSKEGVILS